MYDRIHFFNYFHLGDIHETKEVVRWMTNNVPAKEYVYSHKNPLKIIRDIDGVTFDHNLPLSFDAGWQVIDNVLYVNTWYRTRPDIHDKHECSIQTTYYTMVEELAKLGIEFNGTMLDLIPQIDYERFEIGSAKKFMSEVKGQKRVFISNGNVLSGQSQNFDFDPIITNLAMDFGDVLFFISNDTRTLVSLPNVVYTKDVIRINENDLNENAYIAKHCPIIVGRSSGTHSFSYNVDNFFNGNKLMIDLTKDIRIGTFGLQDIMPERFVHSEDYANAGKIIADCIGGYYGKDSNGID